MKYQNLDDNEILYLISENDEEAYNYMYCKYKPLISKFATVILKNFKYLNLEYDDLIQEGMYGLSLAIKRFDNTSDNIFFTLCYICIKREMYKLVTKANANKRIFLNSCISLDSIKNFETGILVEDVSYNEADNTEYIIDEIEQRKLFLDLKYLLKPKYSMVYELKINGFSNKDIASLLEIRYKDVDNYLRSIKNTIKKKTDIEYLI